ncbi:MAG: acetyl-CoA acetyltransferase [Pseudomonadota bacterium]
MNVADNTPVLVGAGQMTSKLPPQQAPTPLAMIVETARRAARDTGLDEGMLLAKVDTIANTRLAVDSTDIRGIGIGRYRNMPASVAQELGATLRAGFYCGSGGDSPQYLVNEMAQRIADGSSDVVLLAGSENLATLLGGIKSGFKPDWQRDADSDPLEIGSNRPGSTEHENLYGLFLPINTYPLFENALRAQSGRSIEEHRKFLGELFAPFSAVAAGNPHAWFPVARTAEEIATPSPQNRMISFPYTKYMNAIIQVDMAASVLMMSAGTAKKLGIDRSRWVFLNGCAQAYDHWWLSERADFTSSPALRRCGEEALRMAGLGIGDMAHFDIYSCFPSAVQIACRELGIAVNDARGLTLTGGLPYFGGPGNNYVMHSIAEMIGRLRTNPGTHGLLNANGWHVTKHAVGIYSTEPRHAQWQRVLPASYQKDIDALPKVRLTEIASGPARIETYTVNHGPAGPMTGIVAGRLGDGTRFFAHTPNDASVLAELMQKEGVGRHGKVTHENGKNVFRPE